MWVLQMIPYLDSLNFISKPDIPKFNSLVYKDLQYFIEFKITNITLVVFDYSRRFISSLRT